MKLRWKWASKNNSSFYNCKWNFQPGNTQNREDPVETKNGQCSTRKTENRRPIFDIDTDRPSTSTNFRVVDSLLDQEGDALKGGYLPDDSAIYEADDDDEADQSINPVRAHWHSVNFSNSYCKYFVAKFLHNLQYETLLIAKCMKCTEIAHYVLPTGNSKYCTWIVS